MLNVLCVCFCDVVCCPVFNSLMFSLSQDGYVDGVDTAEDASLSVGFSLGFKEGAAQTVAVGRLRGIVR